jgi:uncharacterized protein with HEPN domain
MNNILGEAMASYNGDKQRWCKDYMIEMRKIIMEKYDQVSSSILHYIEKYTI